ncbi:MAG: hypothetical protein U1F57_08560 [bacterium]
MKKLIAFSLGVFALALAGQAQAAPNAYVSTPFGNQVVVIDTANNSLVTTVNVGEFPRGLAVSPKQDKVYVANLGSTDPMNPQPSQISVIQVSNNAATSIVTDPSGAAGTAASFSYRTAAKHMRTTRMQTT